MITVTKEHFSPGQILASGQCFRMEEVKEGVWELVAGDRYLKIEETEEANDFRFHCGEEELRDFWGPYFDLEEDYGAYKKRIDPADAYLVRAADFGWGIRILRQDLWEMIVTFIISQQNNIRRIRRNVQFLAKRYGRRCVSDEGKVYYSFPGPGELAQVTEADLRAGGLGYRSRYIRKTVEAAVMPDISYPAGSGRISYVCISLSTCSLERYSVSPSISLTFPSSISSDMSHALDRLSSQSPKTSAAGALSVAMLTFPMARTLSTMTENNRPTPSFLLPVVTMARMR